MLVNELCHVAGSFNDSCFRMQILDLKLRLSMLYLYSFCLASGRSFIACKSEILDYTVSKK